MISVFGVILVFFCLVLCLAWPLGRYISIVVESPETVKLVSPLRVIEKTFAILLGNNYTKSMSGKEYYLSLLSFHTLSALFLFFVLVFQGYFDHTATNMRIDTAFNTAISFITNTDWQSYIPESGIRWPVNMICVTTQLFFSASVGFTVLAPLIRGFRTTEGSDLGNYWKDLIRFSVYVLLPLCCLLSIALVATGVPQSMASSISYTSLEGCSSTLPINMCASHEAIKQLGTNGGGLFKANSAHPFENPSPLSMLLELVAILLIPVALCRSFGDMVKAPKQGILLVSVMGVLFITLAFLACLSEAHVEALLGETGRSFFQAEGNMEGKECRIGPFWSVLWAIATTATSNGSVNSCLSSFLPLSGGIPLGLMELGEVVFGGIGTGITGAIVFLLIAVFAAGLMVGRTPEYLGKKIEAKEMRLIAMLVVLPASLTLICFSLALSFPQGRAALSSQSAHGMSEALYAFSSAAANNGSAFAGLESNLPLYNISLGIIMCASRLISAAIILALASTLASKKRVATSAGTLSTDTFSFGVWYGFVILIIGALNFLPAFTLGPVIEHMKLFFPITDSPYAGSSRDLSGIVKRDPQIFSQLIDFCPLSKSRSEEVCRARTERPDPSLHKVSYQLKD